MLIVFALMLTSCASTSPTKSLPKRGEAACKVSIVKRAAGTAAFYTEAFFMGEVEGRDEWWLDIPTERVTDKEGRVRAVNVPKARVLRIGEVREIEGVRCVCEPSQWTSTNKGASQW